MNISNNMEERRHKIEIGRLVGIRKPTLQHPVKHWKRDVVRAALMDITNRQKEHSWDGKTDRITTRIPKSVVEPKLSIDATLFAPKRDEVQPKKRNVFSERANDVLKLVPSNVCCIDFHDMDKTLANAQYAHEVIMNYKQAEVRYMPNPEYINLQPHINSNMRAVLIDWLVDVHVMFKLENETLHLSANILDRYLSVDMVEIHNLQLVGISATYIAAKYFEANYKQLKTEDLLNVTNHMYTKKQFLSMESKILLALKGDVGAPSTHIFLKRFLKAARYVSCMHMEIRELSSHYLIQLALQYHCMIRFLPSQRAAAAVLFTARIWGVGFEWNDTMIYYSGGYEEKDLIECMNMYYYVLRKELELIGENGLQALSRKFSHTSFGCVSKVFLQRFYEVSMVVR